MYNGTMPLKLHNVMQAVKNFEVTLSTVHKSSRACQAIVGAIARAACFKAPQVPASSMLPLSPRDLQQDHSPSPGGQAPPSFLHRAAWHAGCCLLAPSCMLSSNFSLLKSKVWHTSWQVDSRMTPLNKLGR